jgi:hypothetical protein
LSPWALQGMGSYAIRTRLRSPNTLFHFHVFSEKSFKNTIFGVQFRSNLRHKFDICVKKGTPKKYLKKGAQTDSNGKLFQCPGAPWQPPSRAHFLNNKQQLSKQWTTTIAEIVKIAKQTHKMLQQNQKNVKVALQT